MACRIRVRNGDLCVNPGSSVDAAMKARCSGRCRCRGARVVCPEVPLTKSNLVRHSLSKSRYSSADFDEFIELRLNARIPWCIEMHRLSWNAS